jgi:hypothetical protein
VIARHSKTTQAHQGDKKTAHGTPYRCGCDIILQPSQGINDFGASLGTSTPFAKGALAAIACVPIGNSSAECQTFFKAEMAKWGKVIQNTGLKAE